MLKCDAERGAFRLAPDEPDLDRTDLDCTDIAREDLAREDLGFAAFATD